MVSNTADMISCTCWTPAFVTIFALVLGIGAQGLREHSELTFDTPISLGLINKSAVSLPQPIYPRASTRRISYSSFTVKIKLDLQEGKVMHAKAISGFPGFRKYAEEAALRARFQPKDIEGTALFAEGVLVYHYPSRIRRGKAREIKGIPVILTGIVNGRAIDLPKPFVPGYSGGGKSKVRIVIDMAGNVIDASAVNGHPQLASASVGAARLAKFSPFSYCCGSPIYVVGYLEYSFGTSEPIRE